MSRSPDAAGSVPRVIPQCTHLRVYRRQEKPLPQKASRQSGQRKPACRTRRWPIPTSQRTLPSSTRVPTPWLRTGPRRSRWTALPTTRPPTYHPTRCRHLRPASVHAAAKRAPWASASSEAVIGWLPPTRTQGFPCGLRSRDALEHRSAPASSSGRDDEWPVRFETNHRASAAGGGARDALAQNQGTLSLPPAHRATAAPHLRPSHAWPPFCPLRPSPLGSRPRPHPPLEGRDGE